MGSKSGKKKKRLYHQSHSLRLLGSVKLHLKHTNRCSERTQEDQSCSASLKEVKGAHLKVMFLLRTLTLIQMSVSLDLV